MMMTLRSKLTRVGCVIGKILAGCSFIAIVMIICMFAGYVLDEYCRFLAYFLATCILVFGSFILGDQIFKELGISFCGRWKK